ncbi:MAG: hypothetical protein DRP85_01720 [Candidatus Makaraimicrobium thalassicum]|nr:MAG: hypothetical protein DRP85_01720 [Candidatus Omnitrophota bacterium]
MKSILVILVCLTSTILIVPEIDIFNHAYTAGRPAYDASFFLRLLGEGKSIVSNLSILQADLYFHGGAGHFHDEHRDGLAIGEREEHLAPVEHRHEKGRSAISPFNVLFRISEETEVTEHVHLHGDQLKEIIPWLYYAAEIDSHNVLAYTLTGFYLSDRLGNPDEGIAFLREGLRNNPDSWEVNAEIGRIYSQHLGNYTAAVRFLSRAWGLLQKVPHDRFQERYVLSFLARSYEALGQGSAALPFYRRINELFPDSGIHEKSGERR